MIANYWEKRWDKEGFSIPRTGQVVKNCPKYLNICVHAKLDTYHKYNIYILLRLMKWKITIQSQRDNGHRSYCTFFQLPWLLSIWAIRAHREIKNQNRDSHTWIFIGNWILNLICFLQFFDLSTPSAAKMRFYYLHFLQGKNAQNRPKNPQNGNLAKIGLKSDNFMK